MSAIGGYFGLELGKPKPEYHAGSVLRLNSGRNAFEYVLHANKYSKVFIPYFTCDVMLEPLKRHSIAYEFYSIDEQLEPIFDFNRIESGAAFLYTNYFGLKDDFISSLKAKCNNLIIDNAQSFYSKQEENVDTIYSPRKFFGVSDGGYLYSNTILKNDFEQDNSTERFSHLLLRIDKSAEEGYSAFAENDRSLENGPIKKMSRLTQRILQSVDYEEIRKVRIENYLFFEKHLASKNRLKVSRPTQQVPMVFPFWSDNTDLRKELIANRIYCASYWPNVLKWTEETSLEYQLATELIHLPIDQRYCLNDLERIIKII